MKYSYKHNIKRYINKEIAGSWLDSASIAAYDYDGWEVPSRRPIFFAWGFLNDKLKLVLQLSDNS